MLHKGFLFLFAEFGVVYEECKYQVYLPKYQKHDPENVRNALAAIDQGMSLRKAAQIYSIPKSVLHRYKTRGVPQRMLSNRFTSAQDASYPASFFTSYKDHSYME